MSWGEVKKAINSDISVPLNELIGSKIEYDTPGTYTFSATSNTLVLVQACGGGGGGYTGSAGVLGGGGGGGAAVVKRSLSVTKGETITIIIGSGGAGVNGGATSISGSVSGALLTLAGGYAATTYSTGGLAGGAGGGAGGARYTQGYQGIIGEGGLGTNSPQMGGGGGGSIGNGGDGGLTTTNGKNGTKGGGGGGGQSPYIAGSGGDGYVLIMTGLYDFINNTTYSLSPKFLTAYSNTTGEHTIFSIRASGTISWICLFGSGAQTAFSSMDIIVDGTKFAISSPTVAANTAYVIGDFPEGSTTMSKFRLKTFSASVPLPFLMPIPFKESFEFKCNPTSAQAFYWGVSYSLKG